MILQNCFDWLTGQDDTFIGIDVDALKITAPFSNTRRQEARIGIGRGRHLGNRVTSGLYRRGKIIRQGHVNHREKLVTLSVAIWVSGVIR